MKIISKSGKEYHVYWAPYGISYSIPLVKVKSKLFGIFNYEKTVWKQWTGQYETHTLLEMERMHKENMQLLFTRTVNGYEDYLESWREQ